MRHSWLKLLPDSLASTWTLDKQGRLDLKPSAEMSVEDPHIAERLTLRVVVLLRVIFVIWVFHFACLDYCGCCFVCWSLIWLFLLFLIIWWLLISLLLFYILTSLPLTVFVRFDLLILAANHHKIPILVADAGVTCAGRWHGPLGDLN